MEARVHRHRIEYGEEIEILPSHLFYLSGCNLRCAFCIGEANSFDSGRGELLTEPYLRDALEWGRAQGARTLQWVGGEPTLHLPAILEALAGCDDLPPVVWKSNFYATAESWELLDEWVDVYIADFKFGNDACARRIAGAERYIETVTRNLQLVVNRGRLIVRHLLMPGHFDCCYRPIVDWLRQLPGVPLSIRDGYLPRWRAAEHEELAGVLDRGVGQQAKDLARQYGLEVIH